MFAIGLLITNKAFISERTKLDAYCLAQKSDEKKIKKDNLDIRYGTVHIKQYHIVSYLGCILDENLSAEPMAL